MIQLPNLPEPVQWVSYAVAGDRFPEGNEDELNRLADGWQELADALSEARPELAGRMAEVTNSYGGAAGMEFLFASYDLLGFGDSGGLMGLWEASMQQHMTVRFGAMDIALTKAAIVMEVLVTAIAVLWAMISAKFTLGLSGVSIGPLIQAGRSGVGQLVARLVASLASRGGTHTFRQLSARAAREILREGAQEALEESFIAAGTGLLAGDAWNWERIVRGGTAGLFGGVAGTAVFGPAFAGLGNRFRGGDIRRGGWRVVGAASWHGSSGNPASSWAGGTVATALFGGEFFWPWEGALAAAVVGGFRSGATRTGGTLGTRLSPLQVDPVTGLLIPRESRVSLNPFREAGPGPIHLTNSIAPALAPLLTQVQRESVAELVDTGRLVSHTGVATSGVPARDGRAPVADLPQALGDLDGVEITYAATDAGGRVHVGATLTGATGTPIGSMARVFGQDGTVEHTSTLLTHDLPAPEQERLDNVFAQVESVYRAAGITEIRLPVETVRVVGGETATDAGFSFPDPGGACPAVRPVGAGGVTADPPRPARPTVDEAVATLRERVAHVPGLSDRIDQKVATLHRLAAVDRDTYELLLGAGFTPAEAQPVVAGEPGALDAARVRLREQETALAELLRSDPELAGQLDRAGVDGDLPGRLTALEEERVAAVAREAAADDRLASFTGGVHGEVSQHLPQVRAVLAEEVRADVVAARISAADVPAPVAADLAEQVVRATVTGEPRSPVDPARIREQLIEAGVLASAAQLLSARLAELVAAGVPTATVDAVIDRVVDGLDQRDPQDVFTALAGALTAAWKLAANAPARPDGGLVDELLAGGVVDDVNTALDHRRSRLRDRRGSVQLAGPAHGAGSGRRFSLRVNSGLRPRAAMVTVTEGSGPAEAQHRDGQLVVRLDRGMTVIDADAFIARAVASTTDDLRARRRWRSISPDGILHKGPLSADFQRDPRTPKVTALDVVNLDLELRRPYRRLAETDRKLAAMAPDDPGRPAVRQRREALVRELRDGAAGLGLGPDGPAAGELADLATTLPREAITERLPARLARLAAHVPPDLLQLARALIHEVTQDAGHATELRQLFADHGIPATRSAELIGSVHTLDSERAANLARQLARQLPDPSVAGRAAHLLERLHHSVDRQQRLVVELLQYGLLGKATAYLAVAARAYAHGNLELARRLTGEVAGTADRIATRTANVRWDRIQPWLAGLLATGQDRLLMRDAAGRPLEPLGLPPRRWHMLRRAGGVATALGIGAALAGPAGWTVAAAAAGIAAAAPVVSGFAGKAYDAKVRITELHQSHPHHHQAWGRRLPPALPPAVAYLLAGSPAAVTPALREGLRGWRDVFAARTWSGAHAGYIARALYKGELPSEYNEPLMDRVDATVGGVTKAAAAIKLARFQDGRRPLTPEERSLLRDAWLELDTVAGGLEATARSRHRRYLAQPITERARMRPPKGLPSGWRYQWRRAPTETLSGAVERVLGVLTDSTIGATAAANVSGGQSLAQAEKWHAMRRYHTATGFEAAAMSRRVREAQAFVKRQLDGTPEASGLHRPRYDPVHWPVYRRRGMPDYAAYALRANTAAAGKVAALLAAWVVGYGAGGGGLSRPLGMSRPAPAIPFSSVLVGGASTIGFSLVTKRGDWRYREVTERARFRMREADLLRELAGEPGPPDPTQLLRELGEVRSEVDHWVAGDRASGAGQPGRGGFRPRGLRRGRNG